jgi:hypothetical protein
MGEDNLIDGVFNYCNRWCERCAFIHRCELGIAEQRRWNQNADRSEEDILEEVEKNLREALGMLDKMIEEAGLEMEDLPNPEDFEEREQNPMVERLHDEIRGKGMHYFKVVNTFFKEHEAAFRTRGVEVFPEKEPNWHDSDRSEVSEALETIRWNMHFQFVKAERAVHGMDDMSDECWEPYQSDANGSAKVSILSLSESIRAWLTMKKYLPELADVMGEFEQMLREFRRMMQMHFYDWQKFVRPGFDTESQEPKFGSN